MTTQTKLGDFGTEQIVTDGGQIEWEEGEENLKTALELEARDDVTWGIADYEDCDVAVLVENGTDIGPIRKGFNVVGVTDYSEVPYTLFKFNQD